MSACRTPITRAKRGGLAATPADDLIAAVLQASVARGKIDVNDVGDIVVGSVLGASSQRANECRIGMFLAGFPKEVPVRTTNRQCSSGLQAVRGHRGGNQGWVLRYGNRCGSGDDDGESDEVGRRD